MSNQKTVIPHDDCPVQNKIASGSARGCALSIKYCVHMQSTCHTDQLFGRCFVSLKIRYYYGKIVEKVQEILLIFKRS